MGSLPAIAQRDRVLGQAGVLHRPRRKRFVHHLENAVWVLGPFGLLLLIWYVVVAATGVPARLFPQIDDVVRAGFRIVSSGQLANDLEASLGRVIIGSALAVVTGVPFGILMGSSRIVSEFFTPLLRFSVSLAGIAWIPLATLWLGYGQVVCVFIIWNSVFFAIVYSTMLGVRSIEGDLRRAAMCLGANDFRLYTEVLLPGSMPSIVAGLRMGLGFAWRALFAAEIIAANSGLGYSIFMAQRYYDTAEIVMIIIVIGVLWLLIDRALLAPFERRTVQRWGMTKRVL
jgi:NitT/TauT family transport system permease protein/taurine transport system permease protein